jgi:hypothetical protein
VPEDYRAHLFLLKKGENIKSIVAKINSKKLLGLLVRYCGLKLEDNGEGDKD